MALNVTTAEIGSSCRRATAAPSLVQWDRGQVLKITGVTLPGSYNVEFCCQGDAETTTMIGGASGVQVPNALLERGLPIIAYLVLHEGQDDRETEYWITINVKQRPQPPEVDPDPEQESVIDQLIAALNAGVESAEGSATDAAASAQDAEDAAEAAALAGETYLLQPTVRAIAFDPNEDAGENLFPASVRVYAFRQYNGSISALLQSGWSIILSVEDGTGQGIISTTTNLSSTKNWANLTLPTETTPDYYVHAQLLKSGVAFAYADITLPIISGGENGATGETGPQGPKGETGYPTDEQVANATDAWLAENVAQETGYVLDRTLSLENAAAPADLVGDLFDQTFAIKANITTDTDLDTIKEPGVYILFSGHTYTHAPLFFTSGAAWLIVYANQTRSQILQYLVRQYNKETAVRTGNTSGGVFSFSDWVCLPPRFQLQGKKLSIVGDSISTYEGYNPSGWPYYYPKGNVDTVGETWWKRVVDRSGMTLLKNASWSGSWICYDSSVSADSAKIAYTDARIDELADGSTTPDIIIVLMGTNDFIHNNGNPVGTLTENDEIPDGTTPITEFKPAYAHMINKIMTTYPHAHVYCCTLIERYRSTDTTYPIKNGNGNSLAVYNKAIVDIANWMGCNIIRLDTAFSLGEIPDYTVDGSLHPNATGFKLIANKVLQELIVHEFNAYGVT